MKRLALLLVVSCNTHVEVSTDPRYARVEVNSDRGVVHVLTTSLEPRIEIVYVPTPFYAGARLAEKP